MSNIYPETCENCKRFRMCDASALCHECQAEIQLEIDFEIDCLAFLALYENRDLTYEEARRIAVAEWKENSE